MAKKNISDATKAELRNFATLHLGLELPPNVGPERLISEIRAAGHQGDTIEVKDAPEAPVQVRSAPQPEVTGDAGAQMLDEWSVKATIRILPDNDESGGEPVFTGVNGRSFLIQRDTEVEVPLPVLVALNNAKQGIADDKGDRIREVHTYRFQILDAPEAVRRALAEG